MNKETANSELFDLAQQYQKECHDFVEKVIKEKAHESDVSYQDATNAWIFKKLAEIRLLIPVSVAIILLFLTSCSVPRYEVAQAKITIARGQVHIQPVQRFRTLPADTTITGYIIKRKRN